MIKGNLLLLVNPGREIYSLNVIGGLDSDYEGSVQISGRNIKDLKGKELDEYRKMNIGLCFSPSTLYLVIQLLKMYCPNRYDYNVKKRGKALNLLSCLGLLGLRINAAFFVRGKQSGNCKALNE